MIQDHGVKAGVSVNPETPVELLKEALPCVDLVLVMSVHPGFGGQKFIPTSIDKVRKLAEWRKQEGHHYLVEIDGGINETTISEPARAGCDVFVAGSAIFKTKDYHDVIKKLRKQI
jgi:ribulose-phosphate 3-epimerase